MDPNMSQWLNLAFRWMHVIAGVMWIGHLWFFNLVNSQVAKTYDADSKVKVVPELMPRALYWFRWGAAYTWISGFMLLGLVYYMGGAVLVDDPAKIGLGAGVGIGVGGLIVGWVVYDLLWKAMAKNPPVGTIISMILVAGTAFGLQQVFSGRAMFIHIGAIFGTAMAANVWMRIWPAQKKILPAIRDGQAPDGDLKALAGLRSRHNTYMSVPLLLLMVSNHFPLAYGHDHAWVIATAFVGLGFFFTNLMYKKAASEAPTKY